MVLRVTINMCKSYLRSSWLKKREEIDDDMRDKTYIENDPTLWELVRQLPEKYRVVVELYFVEGYTIKEISVILKKNPSTIGTWLERGKKQLRKTMEDGENE